MLRANLKTSHKARRTLIVAFVIAGITLASRATGEPVPNPCEDLEPGKCTLRLPNGATTPGGTILPPGFYLDPATYEKLDVEIHRLQESETRLQAERDSLAKDARPVWYWVAGALVTGLVAGYFINR